MFFQPVTAAIMATSPLRMMRIMARLQTTEYPHEERKLIFL